MSPTHRARKRFGQHFLCAPEYIDAIVAAIAPQPNDNLVEVGPGLGAITQHLLPLCQRLDVIEIDRDLAQYQQQHYAHNTHFHLHNADVLQFQLNQLPVTSVRVVGNLPYNITTPLLFHLFDQCTLINDMHFMLQKEVADRLCASVGSTHYSKLSVMTQYHCQVIPLFDLPPSAFDPPPKVTSTFVRLTWAPPCSANVEVLQKIVQQAFNQRRKTLQNSLRGLMTAEQLVTCGIDPKSRAQDVSVAQFVCLSRQSNS